MTAISIILDNVVLITLLVLACSIGYKVGVFNLAVEALLHNSALAFSLCMVLNSRHSIALSTLAALMAGIMMAALYSFFVVVLELEQIVCGIAINLLSVGLCTWVSISWVGAKQIPIGQYDGSATYWWRVFYVSMCPVLLLAAVYTLQMARVAPVLSAIGENCEIARSCDVPVKRLRFGALTASGIYAAIAGALLALVSGGFTTDQWNMGIGYIALAIVVASRGNIFLSLVFGAFFAALGFSETSRITHLPNEIADALPRILLITVFCAFGLWRRRRLRNVGKAAIVAETDFPGRA